MDDLASQIRREQRNQEAFAKQSETRAERVKRDQPRVWLFLLQLFASIEHILVTYVPFMRRFWSFVFSIFRKVWSFVVYRRNSAGDLEFSKVRGSIFLVSVPLFFMFVFAPLVNLFVDTALYVTTAKRNEVVYLTLPQELDSKEDIHSIRGNETAELDETEVLYFRVEDSLFNQLWSLWNKHEFFYPDNVASAVPVGLSRCVTTSYGIRLRVLMRRTNFYPHMLSVRCSYLRQDDKAT